MSFPERYTEMVSVMASPILLNLLIRPAPEEYPETARTRRLMKLWETHVGGGMTDELGDFEDFFEQATRLEAVIATYPLHLIYLTIQGDRTATNLGTGEAIHVDELGDITRFGLQASVDLALNPHLRNESDADRYLSWDTFKKFAGRNSDYCGSQADDPTVVDFTDRLFARYQAGERRVFIKSVAAKKGLWDITLPDTITTIQELENFLNDDEQMGWGLASAAGSRHAFAIQDYTPMSYEYRFFVVGHKLVTGAGCVEQHTPLDNNARFDTKMVQNRHRSDSPVLNRPDTALKLKDFAAQVVESVKTEHPHVSNYVVDVAMDERGNPLVVEFNSILNSGLYASNMFAVVQALRNSKK